MGRARSAPAQRVRPTVSVKTQSSFGGLYGVIVVLILGVIIAFVHRLSSITSFSPLLATSSSSDASPSSSLPPSSSSLPASVLSIEQIQRIGMLVNQKVLKRCELLRARELLASTLHYYQEQQQLDSKILLEEPELLVVYGLTLLSLQELPLGSESLLKAGEFMPHLIYKIYFWIGEAYSRQAKYEDALSYFEKALQGDRNLYYRLAVAQTKVELAGSKQQKRDGEGMRELLQLLQEQPDLMEAIVSAGMVYAGDSSTEKLAESYLLRVVELVPSHRLALSTLVRLYKHSGREADATQLITNALAKGVWTRKDQYPAQLLHAFLPAVSWPSLEELETSYSYLTYAINLLELNWQDISSDLESLSAHFAPNQEGAHDPLKGSWDAFTVNCSGASRGVTRETCRVLDLVASSTGVSVNKAQFLRLEPGGHIRAHCGPSNNRWVVHLGLKCPQGVRIVVGGEERGWQQGKCIVFDDSIEHEVIHNGDSERVVLGLMFPRVLPPQPCDERMPWTKL